MNIKKEIDDDDDDNIQLPTGIGVQENGEKACTINVENLFPGHIKKISTEI
jgi:hypothetical protein